MSRRDLATRLGILTALEKAIKQAKSETRSEAEAMMAEAHDEDGVSSLDILVGETKVGRVGYAKPGVGVYEDSSEFARWSYDHGEGRHLIVIDCDDIGEGRALILKECLDDSSVPYAEQYEARPEARKQLTVVGGHVVDAEGEIVPGTYAKRPGIRVTGCKPAEVGEAMRALGDASTIAGLLGGETA